MSSVPQKLPTSIEGTLELLAGDNPSISIYGPSGFAFELVPPKTRSRRYQEVARRVEPICNRKTFASKAKVTVP